METALDFGLADRSLALVDQVVLVARDFDDYVVRAHSVVQLLQPVFEVLQTFGVSVVEHQDRGMRVSVVERHEVAERVLAGSIPQLKVNVLLVRIRPTSAR